MLEKKLVEYQTESGRQPFTEWLCSKKTNIEVRAAADVRLNRLMVGLAGDCRPVGEGVFELRIHIGPGYRVYFAYSGRELILLLGGGDKKSQARDIVLAKKYWADFKRRNKS